MVSKENYRSLIRCIGWFGLIIPKLRNITQVVRILPPPRAWIHTRLGHAKPQCFGDSRDSKNDSILGARREIQRRRRHAPSCMGATELQSNWPEVRKTLRKPLVLQRRGQEPNFSMFSEWFWGVREVVFRSTVIENEEPLSTTASPRKA